MSRLLLRGFGQYQFPLRFRRLFALETAIYWTIKQLLTYFHHFDLSMLLVLPVNTDFMAESDLCWKINLKFVYFRRYRRKLFWKKVLLEGKTIEMIVWGTDWRASLSNLLKTESTCENCGTWNLTMHALDRIHPCHTFFRGFVWTLNHLRRFASSNARVVFAPALYERGNSIKFG